MAGSAFNNAVNVIYYNYIADENRTDLTSSSYYGKYMTRWDRLDYTKSQTKNSWYGFNEMRFFLEYTAHMWAWCISKFAYDKDVPLFSWLAEHSREADISPDQGDSGANAWRNIVYYIFGLLGV